MADRRRWLFGISTVALTWVSIELFTLLLLGVVRGRWSPLSEQQQARNRILEQREDDHTAADTLPEREVDNPIYLGAESIHPYLGYVLDGGFARQRRRATETQEGIDFGFRLEEPGLFRKGQLRGRPAIAVFGGSVAFHFARAIGGELRQEFLSRLPGYEEAAVFNLALPGYKQPQQLMALSYFLSLGAKLDLVINLDGFNEVVLPRSENLNKGVFPFFPRSWYFRVRELDPGLRLAIGELAYRQQRRRDLAARFSRPPWRYSPFAGLFWSWLDRRQERALLHLEIELQQDSASSDEDYTVTGPPWQADAERTERALVAVWSRSSLQIEALAEAAGIRYYHFLQPNQHLEGSKPMAPEERRLALGGPANLFHLYGRASYPLLVETGRELADRGVRYFDLTAIFRDVEEPVYKDRCCHLNEHGQLLMVREIAQRIGADLGLPADHPGAP